MFFWEEDAARLKELHEINLQFRMLCHEHLIALDRKLDDLLKMHESLSHKLHFVDFGLNIPKEKKEKKVKKEPKLPNKNKL